MLHVNSFKKYALCLLSFSALSFAGPQDSPVGRWVTTDDKTGEKKSIVEIVDAGGELKGKVVKLLSKPKSPDDKRLCTACGGDRKDQPILGMEILWGYKKQSDDKWADGQILDPDNGKTYSSHMTLEKDGKKLDVRGFIGFSLLGRTQEWVRE